MFLSNSLSYNIYFILFYIISKLLFLAQIILKRMANFLKKVSNEKSSPVLKYNTLNYKINEGTPDDYYSEKSNDSFRVENEKTEWKNFAHSKNDDADNLY